MITRNLSTTPAPGEPSPGQSAQRGVTDRMQDEARAADTARAPDRPGGRTP